MLFGYNQNIIYNGKIYHIQTEDGGKSNPMVTTLLFLGGSISYKKTTSYSDILKSEQLEEVVREIMSDQHKAVIDDLISGTLDKELNR